MEGAGERGGKEGEEGVVDDGMARAVALCGAADSVTKKSRAFVPLLRRRVARGLR